MARIAYILLWFPERSETFILDEVNTLVGLGMDLKVYTLYGTSPRPTPGMEGVRAPVHRLGIFRAIPLLRDLIRLRVDWGKGSVKFLLRVLLRRWRGLETAAEAFWAVLAAPHLAGLFQQEGIQHIHAPWANGPATAAWVASRLTGIPMSFCGRAHDIYPPDGALKEKMEAALFVRAENEANKRHMVKACPFMGHKILRIYPGSPFREERHCKRNDNPHPGLLAIGRFVPSKGFVILLRACKELVSKGMPFHLTLAGSGLQGLRIRWLIWRYGLKSKVTLPGFVPHRKVIRLLERADLFIMPSVVSPSGNRDGVPTVILEALTYQVPVVATAVGGIPEVIFPGETGWLVQPGDPEALAHAIMEALTDPTEARRRAKMGLALVETQFDSVINYSRLRVLIGQG